MPESIGLFEPNARIMPSKYAKKVADKPTVSSPGAGSDADTSEGDEVFVDGMPVGVARVQPFQSNKSYRCPGCNQLIAPGIGHIVVVPTEAADLRRHWHTPCWQSRDDRRPGKGSVRPDHANRR
jgi:hypothetical protein